MFIADLSFYKKLSKKRSHSFAEKLAPLIPNGSHVLDFGCGNMYTAERLIELNPTYQITGVDVIKDQNLKDELLAKPQLKFVVSTSDRLPFADETFDAVLALATMHHTPSPEYFLSELKRVIKKDGAVILVEEMYINFLDKIYISAQDWLLNNLKEGVPVPLNFRSNKAYLNEFKKQGLNVVFEGSVRPIPTLMHHYIYKLAKAK